MTIFETDRLIIRELTALDSVNYYDMMGNPNVMDLIPRKVMSSEESDKHLMGFVNKEHELLKTVVWGIETNDENEFIGICAFLKNDDNDDEIAYRLREKYWKKGYGSETAKGLISFGFKQLKMEKITADVYTENIKSIRILEKYMSFKKDFFNASDNCIDRRYEIYNQDWHE